MRLSHRIIDWIRAQVRAAGKKGVVVGLSGGIDSSVVVVLSKKALGDNVLGLVLPCRSQVVDQEFAVRLAKKFGIKYKKADLSSLFDMMRSVYPEAGDMARANLKPRLRMTALYYFANSLDYLVAGTGNKSEIKIGYFTKHGDGGCDILPIGGLFKTEVRALAKELELPEEIIKRPPSAGLWDGQTDENEIGMRYENLDKCLMAIETKREPSDWRMEIEKIRSRIRGSEHKRRAPPVFTRCG